MNSHSFHGSGFDSSLAGWFGLRVSLSEGSNRAGDPVSKVMHSHGWQVAAGYRQETSFALREDLATGLLEFPHDWQVASTRESDWRREGRSSIFYDLGLEVTHLSACSISYTSPS